MKESQFRRASVTTAVGKSWSPTCVTASDGGESTYSLVAIDHPSLLMACSIVALSCTLYIPFLELPLLPDDYLQITLGQKLRHSTGWLSLLGDPLFRNRATSLILTYTTDLLFPFSRIAFGVSSILLHAVNGLLVYALGTMRSVGWRLSALSAIVFVLQERHHEAVIWYAALPELLVFFFTFGCLLLWIQWLRLPTKSVGLWLGVLVCFISALVSKESGLAAFFLMIILAAAERASLRRVIAGLVPLVPVVAAYVISIFLGRDQNHHFIDGTFALQMGFVGVVLRSASRGLWVWGWVGLGALTILGVRHRLLLTAALCWIVAALLPYSFLTYMDTVPSRHHYLAAVGYSMITALALQHSLDRTRKLRVVGVCLLVIALHHTSYLWTAKYRQFQKRSEPIESFIRFLQNEPRRPVLIHCSDYYFSEARRAAYLRLKEPEGNFVLNASGADRHSIAYCLPGPL